MRVARENCPGSALRHQVLAGGGCGDTSGPGIGHARTNAITTERLAHATTRPTYSMTWGELLCVADATLSSMLRLPAELFEYPRCLLYTPSQPVKPRNDHWLWVRLLGEPPVRVDFDAYRGRVCGDDWERAWELVRWGLFRGAWWGSWVLFPVGAEPDGVSREGGHASEGHSGLR
jgi:hypothetical protein